MDTPPTWDSFKESLQGKKLEGACLSIMRLFLKEGRRGKLAITQAEIEQQTGLTRHAIRTCLLYLLQKGEFKAVSPTSGTAYRIVNFTAYNRRPKKSTAREPSQFVEQMTPLWAQICTNGMVPYSMFMKWKGQYGEELCLQTIGNIAARGQVQTDNPIPYITKALRRNYSRSMVATPLVRQKSYADTAKERGWA